MVSKLIEGLEGASSTVANVDGAVTFLTSMLADVFGSGWTSDVVKTSAAGTSTGFDFDFGSSSGKGCACSAVTQRKTVTIIANVNMY